jgi:xanthosine utilization system XapX-like protein
MRELMRRRPLVRFAAALAAVLAVLALSATPARADVPAGFTWSATIDDQSLADPIALGQRDQTVVEVVLRNQSADELRIRSLRLDGQVIGLTFFSFTTRVDIVLPPGATAERRITLDLDNLTQQATGLIPSRLSLLGTDRSVLTAQPVSVDVKGSPTSLYAVFGFSIAAITLVLLATLLLALRRGTGLTRGRRALRFLLVGLGAGLSLTLILSAFSVLLPATGIWVATMLGLGLVGLVVGLLLPVRPERGEEPAAEVAADSDELEEHDDLSDLDEPADHDDSSHDRSKHDPSDGDELARDRIELAHDRKVGAGQPGELETNERPLALHGARPSWPPHPEGPSR